MVLKQLLKVGDDCQWYFVNLTVDVTFGVIICYLIHQLVERIAIKYEINVSACNGSN